ncbi:L-methionine/branched-chain amino acid transporter [Vibrio sp. JC009]|uniref:L-methionine/branched-chain amino acid transporter n=1 Tax=Vibrio sp. JC009 TaxID=2912314 RepID=UPI0023AF494B|nr:L-methionine/branched-chain amino acid transporter [Vibrio sp. JC009]WED24197.1 L-methionine/branched-chain amino acid transporter [Vibrio sp. JC009]
MGELKKEITLMSGIGQLSTTLLGTGLFMIPAIAAGIAGQVSLWAWAILFIAVVPIALTFAALGKRFPSAGGTAYFVRKAFNPKLERSVAWLFLSVIPVGIPAGIVLAGSFGVQLLPAPFDHPLIAEALTIALLVFVNLTGSKSSSRIQTLIALGIFSLIALFWIYGDVSLTDARMPAIDMEHLPSIGSALAVMFWCFVGIEAFAHMGEEFKNPQRDFPIAIIVGCLVAGVVYWACTVVVLKFFAYGTPLLEKGSIPWISEQLFGSKVSVIISIIGYLACFASLNLYMQSLARMAWAQAKTTKPDSKMATLSSKGVPAFATLTIAAILSVSSVIGEVLHLQLDDLVKLANGVFILIYLLAMLSAVKLLSGTNKALAFIALVITGCVFTFLKWAALYAITVFVLVHFVKNPKYSDRYADTSVNNSSS